MILRRIALQLLALAPLALSAGCSFYGLKGNGPAPREKCTALLKDEPKLVEEWKQQAFKPSMMFLGSGTVHVRKPFWGPLKGYTEHRWLTPNWAILAGPHEQCSFLEPPEAEKQSKRSVVHRYAGWGILFPLFARFSEASYDYPSGDTLWLTRDTIVTAFLYRHNVTVQPAGVSWAGVKKGLSLECLDRSKPLKDMKYDRMSSTCIALGLVAWGTKNGRAYVQFAWIPIPLGNVKQDN